jgi:hypothetical protein
MKSSTDILLEIEPLFHFLIRASERHEDDQIHFSLTRAKEIHSDLKALKKAQPPVEPKHYSATDKHLDKMFNIN